MQQILQSRVLFQEFACCPAFVGIHVFHVKADVTAVFHGYPDVSLILRDLSDLVNGETFFKDFCIPSDCQYSAVSGDLVDDGAEVQGQKEDGNQDKNHSQHPEDGCFGTLNEEL